MIQDDRATRPQVDSDFPDSGLGDDLRSFLASDVQPGRVVLAGGSVIDDRVERGTGRQRNLLATFRAVPGDRAATSGFPGTRTFAPGRVSLAPHRSDPGAAGSTVQPAGSGDVGQPTPAPGSNDLEGWRAAIQQAGPAATTDGPAVAAAESADGGRRRGWGAEGARTAADSASRSRTANDTVVRTPSGAKGAGRGAAKKPAKAGPALPKDIAKLIPKDAGAATPRVIVPTPTERATAASLFREIGDRFNTNRKKSKTAAYAGYRHDLMANLDTLVMGGALDLKDATTIITNLEQYTKETEAESTETPATILGRWLRMSAEEVAGLEAPVEEVVEDEENLGEEVEQSDIFI